MPRRHEETTHTGMTPAERLAAIHFTAKRQQQKITQVAKEQWQCSYSHARLVLYNRRSPSPKLAERIANFAGVSLKEFWGRDKFNEQYVPVRKKH